MYWYDCNDAQGESCTILFFLYIIITSAYKGKVPVAFPLVEDDIYQCVHTRTWSNDPEGSSRRDEAMNLSLIDILFVITVVLMVFNGLRNGFVFSLVNFLSVPVG